MMICKADFEELFPHLFKPDPEPEADLAPEVQTAAEGADLARITAPAEGGALPLALDPRAPAVPRRGADYGYDVEDIALAGAVAATMPAMATYAAARNVFTAFEQMANGRHAPV